VAGPFEPAAVALEHAGPAAGPSGEPGCGRPGAEALECAGSLAVTFSFLASASDFQPVGSFLVLAGPESAMA
jgi:hypothetical protein